MKKILLPISFVLFAVSIAFAVSTAPIALFGTLIARVTVPANATTTTAAKCFAQADDAFLFALDADAVSGTTPTLDVKIQNSPDGVNYVDTGVVFTQVTTVDKYYTISTSNTQFGKCFRAVLTSAGTSPVFNAAVRMFSRKVT